MNTEQEAIPKWIETVEARRANLRVTKRELAKKAGLSHTSVIRLMKGQSNPRPASVRALARALEMDELALLREAGIVTEDESRPEDEWARRILAVLDSLPPELKPRAVEMFEAGVQSLRGLAIAPLPAEAHIGASGGEIIGEASDDDSAQAPNDAETK